MERKVDRPEEDVAILELCGDRLDFGSRSESRRRAVLLLRASKLGDDYEAAWSEPPVAEGGSDDAEAW